MKYEGEMITEEKKGMEPRTESFLDEALRVSGEVVSLRNRLAAARREHAELLEQREESLSEGIDLLPGIRLKHLEIEKLPTEIAQLEGEVRWLVERGIEKLNYENSRIAGQQYIKNRDALRKALEPFREALVSVLRNVETSFALGPYLTDVHNIKLGEIETILGNVHLSRVGYQILSLPPLDAELVKRNQVLAALDRWIGGLR